MSTTDECVRYCRRPLPQRSPGAPLHAVVLLLALASLTSLSAALCAATPAQNHTRLPAGSVEIDGGGDRTIVPFELVNHHVILPVTVGGTELRIVLDTGMPSAGLLLYSNERTAAAAIDFDPNMRAQIGGAGGSGERHFAQMAPGVSFTLPGVRVSDSTITKLPEMPHMPIYHDGIIGFSLFDRFVVELDFENQIMTLVEPEKFKPVLGDTGLPFELVMGVPHIRLAVAIDGGERFSTEVVVDLGASHALSLNTDSSEAITVPEKSIASPLGRGLSGPLMGRVGRVDEVVLGTHRMTSVPVSFPESAHQNPRGAEGLGGNLGTGLLSRFRVAFDYSRRRMWVRPRQGFDAPFPADRSGLVFAHDRGDGLLVDAVVEGSPAAEAGITAGDRVLRLDGKDVGPLDRLDARERLQGDGRVTCTVRSSRGERDLELRLADLI